MQFVAEAELREGAVMQIEVTNRWHETFSGAHVGVLLVANIDTTKHTSRLEARKREIEARLRGTFAGSSRAELLELDVLKAYRSYYKRFDQTYHVQLQLESVVHKGKSLPSVSPLVDANFAAELETLVLTAGHGADLLEPPLTLDGTRGGEAFTQMSGAEKSLKPNDMMMSDRRGVICTVLYGQDRRTPISPTTRRALYVAYAPAGVPVGAVAQQLNAIHDNVGLFAPEVEVAQLDLDAADSASRLPVEGTHD